MTRTRQSRQPDQSPAEPLAGGTRSTVAGRPPGAEELVRIDAWWRAANYLSVPGGIPSHVWRQDHNGFSHQDPGFIDHVVNKKTDVIRVYLPPDANTLLSVADHCLRTKQYVNVIVAGKQPALQYLPMDRAIVHANKGIGIWDWASTDQHSEPDVVMACAGDVPRWRRSPRRRCSSATSPTCASGSSTWWA